MPFLLTHKSVWDWNFLWHWYVAITQIPHLHTLWRLPEENDGFLVCVNVHIGEDKTIQAYVPCFSLFCFSTSLCLGTDAVFWYFCCRVWIVSNILFTCRLSLRSILMYEAALFGQIRYSSFGGDWNCSFLCQLTKCPKMHALVYAVLCDRAF